MARARYAGEQQREGAMQLTIEQMEQLTTREKVLDHGAVVILSVRIMKCRREI